MMLSVGRTGQQKWLHCVVHFENSISNYVWTDPILLLRSFLLYIMLGVIV
jgi:hypothetical protein